MKKLLKIIKNNWGVTYNTLDMETPLITLSEQIAMVSENSTLEEVYKMYVGNPSIHLPGLIAFYIIDELGIDAEKVNVNMKLSHIISL